MTQEQCAEFLGIDVEEVTRREREAVRKLLHGVCDVLGIRDTTVIEAELGVAVDESLFAQAQDFRNDREATQELD